MSINHKLTRSVLVVAGVLVATGMLARGCASPFGITCTEEGEFAVHVEVRDAATGAPAAEGATLIIREGEYVDSMRGSVDLPPPPVLSAGLEREGTYHVVVRKSGYEDWIRENVQVRRGGECNKLQPVQLKASLRRLPM
jgi:hypothetical protein